MTSVHPATMSGDFRLSARIKRGLQFTVRFAVDEIRAALDPEPESPWRLDDEAVQLVLGALQPPQGEGFAAQMSELALQHKATVNAPSADRVLSPDLPP